VAPGRRIDTVEEVLSKGDEIGVRVVEVDRERGRIGLRLSEDPDIQGKTAEELAGVGTGDPGPPRRDRGDRRDGRGGRDGRPRDRDRDRGRVRDRDPERS
jgi:polyribonucleotide nucleotidyltransferase